MFVDDAVSISHLRLCLAETPVKDQATAPAEQKQPFVVSAPGHYPEAPIWTDWILFGVGWICGIAWLIGALVPLCRRPRFPATRNKAGWIANVIGVYFALP